MPSTVSTLTAKRMELKSSYNCLEFDWDDFNG